PSAQTSPTPVTTTRRVTARLLLSSWNDVRCGGVPAAAVAQAYLDLACLSMYSTASLTVVIFSASSSGTSMPKASSNAMTNSTWSSESAPRSSTKDAVGVTSASSTPSCSTIICFTRSSTLAIPIPPRSLIALSVDLCLRSPGLSACTMRAEYSRAKIVGLDPSRQPCHSIYPASQGQLCWLQTRHL